MVDQETAALRFELFARLDQLLALPVDCTPLFFFFFARDADHGQGFFVSLDEAIQLKTERLGVAPLGLHPRPALIELLWTDYHDR
jgi:hypothetical protein